MKRLDLPPELRETFDALREDIESGPKTEEEYKKMIAESYCEMTGISLDRVLVEGTGGRYWIFVRREEESHDGP